MMLHKWKLIHFTFASDIRGDLVAIDLENQLPFRPVRFFSTSNVPVGTVRGSHAHLNCHQVFIALCGEILVTLDDGYSEQSFLLNQPSVGLYVCNLVWGTQKSLTINSVLGVFASHLFSESDYVREYSKFKQLI
jgi:hypothetical protein